MRYQDIKRHLKPYVMTANRTTTINHAFAASIAPSDIYNELTVREGLKILGQDPDDDLLCAYCGTQAETWDHVHATVKNKEFSGRAHRLGNLLPCCKPCNSKKGNRDWRVFLQRLDISDDLRRTRERCVDAYLAKYAVVDVIPKELPEYQELQEVRHKVLELFKKADKLADIIRGKSKAI